MLYVESLGQFTEGMKEKFNLAWELAVLSEEAGLDWSFMILEAEESHILHQKIENLGDAEWEEEIEGWGRFYCFVVGNAGDGAFVALASKNP